MEGKQRQEKDVAVWDDGVPENLDDLIKKSFLFLSVCTSVFLPRH